MASCSSFGSQSSSCLNMGCRFYPQARVKSAVAYCVGAALPPSGVAADACYSVASGMSAEIGAAAT